MPPAFLLHAISLTTKQCGQDFLARILGKLRLSWVERGAGMGPLEELGTRSRR